MFELILSIWICEVLDTEGRGSHEVAGAVTGGIQCGTFPDLSILILTAAKQHKKSTSLSSVPAQPVLWRFIHVKCMLKYLEM